MLFKCIIPHEFYGFVAGTHYVASSNLKGMSGKPVIGCPNWNSNTQIPFGIYANSGYWRRHFERVEQIGEQSFADIWDSNGDQ